MFELVEWTKSQGLLDDPIKEAREANPGNRPLKDFVTAYFAAPRP